MRFPGKCNSFQIYRQNYIFDWAITMYPALMFELEHLSDGPDAFIHRYTAEPSCPGTIMYVHHNLHNKEIQNTMRRRFERMVSDISNPEKTLLFVRKENDQYSGRNLTREEIIRLRDLLRKIVPIEKSFTLHMIGYHSDQNLTFQHLETITENNCTVEWDSFPSHPLAWGHPHAWSAWLENYDYVPKGTKPTIPVGSNPKQLVNKIPSQIKTNVHNSGI